MNLFAEMNPISQFYYKGLIWGGPSVTYCNTFNVDCYEAVWKIIVEK